MRLAFLAAALATLLVAPPAAASERVVDPAEWRIVQSQSGPDNYYAQAHEGPVSFIRARYRPPMAAAVLGWEAPDAAHKTAHTLRWKWRVEALPRGGDECSKDASDSAAVLYATWKRGLRWYSLKFVWSTVSPKGATCDRKRNPFVAQDTIVLESGGPLDQWRGESVDLQTEFRRHFEDGRADAEVPEFQGVGLMSEGDQTRSESAADFAEVTLTY